MSGRRIFVTGGTGFIGAAFVRRLLAERHQVSALVRPRSPRALPEGARRVEGDLTRPESYLAALAGQDDAAAGARQAPARAVQVPFEQVARSRHSRRGALP